MDAMNLREIVGLNVRDYRRKREFSQEMLSQICGLHRSYLGAVERGEHNIGVENLSRLSRGLDVPAARLLELAQASSDDADEAPVDEIPVAVLSKRRFITLLDQCAADRPDLVMLYLSRCGVRFIE